MTPVSVYIDALAYELGGVARTWAEIERNPRLIHVLTKEEAIEVEQAVSAQTGINQAASWKLWSELNGRSVRCHLIVSTEIDRQRIQDEYIPLAEKAGVRLTWEESIDQVAVTVPFGGSGLSEPALGRHLSRIVRLWPNHRDSDLLMDWLNHPHKVDSAEPRYSDLVVDKGRLYASVAGTDRRTKVESAIEGAMTFYRQKQSYELLRQAKYVSLID